MNRPEKRMNRHRQAFTLIEVLLAVVLAVGCILTVVAVFPRTVAHTAERARDAQAVVHTTAQAQLIEEQFREYGFRGFTDGNSRALRAVFTTGGVTTVPLQQNIHAQTLLDIPGLNVPIGGEVLLVTGTGIAKLLTVTDRPDSTHFKVDCPTGLPSNTNIDAYPARSLTLDLTGGTLKRTTRGVTDTLGSSTGLAFSYLYETPEGQLIRDPQGAPANTVPAGKLVGLVPVAIDAPTTISRLSNIPLEPMSVSRILGCAEMGLTIPNEGRVNVTILGVPSGATADVTINGPDPAVDNQHPTTSRAYTPVQPGSYSLTARDLTVAGQTYVATVGGSPARLYNTWGDIQLQASYAISTGSIILTVTGLPAGGTTRLDVAGPTTISKSGIANGSYAVDGLLPGTYTVTGTNYTSGSDVYTSPSITGTVSVGGRTPATLTFSTGISTGNLHINVAGLNGAQGPATLTGPFNANLTLIDGTNLLSNLPVGNYVLTPSPVGNLTSSLPRYSVTITKDTTQTVTVVYSGRQAQPTGDITLKVIGLPPVSGAAVQVRGPALVQMNPMNTLQRVVATSLPTGHYTIVAPTALNSNGVSVTPSVNGASFDLTQGQWIEVTVDYSATGGGGGGVVTPPPDREGADCGAGMSHSYCDDNNLYNYAPGFHPPTNGPNDPATNLDGTPRTPVETPPAPGLVEGPPAPVEGPPAPAGPPAPVDNPPTPAPTPDPGIPGLDACSPGTPC